MDNPDKNNVQKHFLLDFSSEGSSEIIHIDKVCRERIDDYQNFVSTENLDKNDKIKFCKFIDDIVSRAKIKLNTISSHN